MDLYILKTTFTPIDIIFLAIKRILFFFSFDSVDKIWSTLNVLSKSSPRSRDLTPLIKVCLSYLAEWQINSCWYLMPNPVHTLAFWVNYLQVTFLHKSEHICFHTFNDVKTCYCLHSVKCYQVLLSDSNISIWHNLIVSSTPIKFNSILIVYLHLVKCFKV